MADPLGDLDREISAGLKSLWGVPRRLLTALSEGFAWAISLIIGGRP